MLRANGGVPSWMPVGPCAPSVACGRLTATTVGRGGTSCMAKSATAPLSRMREWWCWVGGVVTQPPSGRMLARIALRPQGVGMCLPANFFKKIKFSHLKKQAIR